MAKFELTYSYIFIRNRKKYLCSAKIQFLFLVHALILKNTLKIRTFLIVDIKILNRLPNDRMQVRLVRLGEYNTKTNPDCEGSICNEPYQDILPRSIHHHKLFGHPILRNDIAIITLLTPAKFTSKKKNKRFIITLPLDWIDCNAKIFYRLC